MASTDARSASVSPNALKRNAILGSLASWRHGHCRPDQQQIGERTADINPGDDGFIGWDAGRVDLSATFVRLQTKLEPRLPGKLNSRCPTFGSAVSARRGRQIVFQQHDVARFVFLRNIRFGKPGEGVEFLAFAGSLLIGGDEGLHPFGAPRGRRRHARPRSCRDERVLVLIRPSSTMPGVTTIRVRLPDQEVDALVPMKPRDSNCRHRRP